MLIRVVSGATCESAQPVSRKLCKTAEAQGAVHIERRVIAHSCVYRQP